MFISSIVIFCVSLCLISVKSIMYLLFIYLIGALSISFMCSILEAVLLSTPLSYATMLEEQGKKSAKTLSDYKKNVDRPFAQYHSAHHRCSWCWLRGCKGFWRSILWRGVGRTDTAHFGGIRDYP